MATVRVRGLEQMERGLDEWLRDRYSGARAACALLAQRLEDYAHAHHLWVSRTGRTEVHTLGTWEVLEDHLYRVVLSAGMDYNVFLETIKEGTYAWLWPAVEANRGYARQLFVEFLKDSSAR